jgi:hypothetical protein
MDIETVNTETPAVETTTEAEVVNTQVTPEASAETVVEEFTPNYKYKAYGKEYEVEDWAKPLLNKDTQPHLIKLFEKAGGFEPLKSSYESTKQELGTYRTAYSELDAARNQIVTSMERGDLGSVFKILGLDNNQIREFVKQQLIYEGLPPEQKREIDERNQLTQSQHLYQEQLRQQQEYTQSLVMEKHEMEIKFAFENPKYAPLIASYNQKAGDPNAFRAVMDRIGAYEFNINNRNISVVEAIEQAAKMLGLENQPAMPTGQAPVGNQTQSRTPSPKPIIVPNGASSETPMKKRPMSIADLEKEYQQLAN